MGARTQTNRLTGQILEHLLRTPRCFAWRQNTSGLMDMRTGGWRSSPKAGVPDILAVYKSRFYGIEVKTGTDRLRELQRSFIASAEYAGGKVLVVHDFEDFLLQWNML